MRLTFYLDECLDKALIKEIEKYNNKSAFIRYCISQVVWNQSPLRQAIDVPCSKDESEVFKRA